MTPDLPDLGRTVRSAHRGSQTKDHFDPSVLHHQTYTYLTASAHATGIYGWKCSCGAESQPGDRFYSRQEALDDSQRLFDRTIVPHDRNSGFRRVPGEGVDVRDGEDNLIVHRVDDRPETLTAPRPPRICPTKTPEVHELGEFPMTCYNCHMEADS